MIDPFEKFRTINFVNINSLQRLTSELRNQNYFIFEVNGSDIEDAVSFFLKAKEILPQDPPLSGNVHWDAFRDSVRNGLEELGESKVAIVWTDVENMLRHGLADLCVATQYFSDVSSDVFAPATEPRVRLLTFLVGAGRNFKKLDI